MKTGRGDLMDAHSFEGGGGTIEQYSSGWVDSAKSFGRNVLKAATISVPAATALTFVATEVESQSTPVETKFSFNMNGSTVADLGPLGRAYYPASLGPFGLSVDVGTIPSQEGVVSEAVIYDQLERAYLNSDQVAAAVGREIASEAGRNLLIYTFGSMAVSLAAFRAYPSLRHNAGKISLASMSAMALYVGYQQQSPAAAGDHYLTIADGTPLEGISADGAPIQLALEKGLPRFEEMRQRQQENMDDFMQKIGLALERRAESICQGTEGHTAVLVLADTHASEFAARMQGVLHEECQPDVVVHAGDLVDKGSPGEAYYVNQFADIIPVGVGAAISPGNHDPDGIIDQIRTTPVKVLDGEMIEVNGINILGGIDPVLTPIVGPNIQDRNPDDEIYNQEDLGRALAEKATEERPEIVTVHQPRAVKSFIDYFKGSVIPASLIVNGHYHEQDGPDIIYNSDGTHTLKVQMGTAAGKVPFSLDRNWRTDSTPLTTAPYLMAYINNETGLVSWFYLVEITPDGKVISERTEIVPGRYVSTPPNVF